MSNTYLPYAVAPVIMVTVVIACGEVVLLILILFSIKDAPYIANEMRI